MLLQPESVDVTTTSLLPLVFGENEPLEGELVLIDQTPEPFAMVLNVAPATTTFTALVASAEPVNEGVVLLVVRKSTVGTEGLDGSERFTGPANVFEVQPLSVTEILV